MKPRYDKKRVFRDAHKQWRAVNGRPGWDFARALRLAWAVEKKRAAGPEYYQPRITAAYVISATGRARDFIWL